jgi:hypothetical protein
MVQHGGVFKRRWVEICPRRQIFTVVSPHTWLRIKSFPSRRLHVICNKREGEETTENTAPVGVRNLLIALQISLQTCLVLLRGRTAEHSQNSGIERRGQVRNTPYVLYFGSFWFKPSRLFCLFLQKFVFICLSFSKQAPGLYILLSVECSWSKLPKLLLNTQRKSKNFVLKFKPRLSL